MQFRPQQRLDLVVASSEGQRTALQQLRRIADVDQSPVQIVGVEEGYYLNVDITLDCTRYQRVDGGLPLHDREGITLSIPVSFPFKPPSANTTHTRFGGFGHVQWGTELCLYQSPDTQWVPSRGMFGFMAQLDEWLRRGARNELDDLEGPLHPPVAYNFASNSICVNANTPSRDTWPWFGAAIFNYRKPGLLEVNDWAPVHALPEDQAFIPTILLDFELPFEYPGTADYLLCYLENRGVSGDLVLAYLMLASERVPEGKPLHVGIGAPSRGIAGDLTQRRQHLQFWEIGEADVARLRTASLDCDLSNHYKEPDTPKQIQALIKPVIDDLFRWRSQAYIRWCPVIENRPEIIVRRDDGTAMDWFRDKRVALWGCGAIGGLVAEHLARAGVAQLTLYDNSRVIPGLLVRQNFVDADINDSKAEALARRIEAIAPSINVTTKAEDIVGQTLDRTDWDTDIDVVIDATASLSVRSKLEVVLKTHERNIPIASIMISATARDAVAVLTPPNYQSGPLDVFRRLGLTAMNRDWLSGWVEAFWTTEANEGLRQPEPGCSDPTFVASHVDMAALASQALNALAAEFESGSDSASGFLITQSLGCSDHHFRYQPDICWVADGIDFRLSANAWRDMTGWIRAGARERSEKDETGGLLFGEFDETLGIVWVTSVSGPPQDSVFSPEGFICGTYGTSDMCDDYEQRTYGSVRYVGTWHSHPVSSAEPSTTDYAGISTIFASAPEGGAHQLMVIVGHASKQQPQIGAYVFEKQALVTHPTEVEVELEVRGGLTVPPRIASLGKTIGISLSGGGSRAVAFHLGTLRALEDLNLLDEIDVISGVSGGSMMTALLGYTEAPFSEVDRKAVDFLRCGLVIPTLKKCVHPIRVARLLWNIVIAVLPMMIIGFITRIVGGFASFLPAFRSVSNMAARWLWSPRFRYSRTHVMADAVAGFIGEAKCDSATRGGKAIVFNACELRTGTAFRMSNERFGSWRHGWAQAGDLRIADAVAASAAYPPFLPPFDWKRHFERDGKTSMRRVIVTDGGVFENLGVTVMEPGRDTQISAISHSPSIIIASDAGVGQLTGEIVPMTWSKRMVQVVDAVMRKVQDATKQRLHDHAKAGRIDGFVYVGLGQLDERVHLKPGNWVDRQEVVHYPTDFSAMPESKIQKFAGRGEAITRALVTQYLLTD